MIRCPFGLLASRATFDLDVAATRAMTEQVGVGVRRVGGEPAARLPDDAATEQVADDCRQVGEFEQLGEPIAPTIRQLPVDAVQGLVDVLDRAPDDANV